MLKKLKQFKRRSVFRKRLVKLLDEESVAELREHFKHLDQD